MANDFLIVVDMQTDFVSGSLGTPEARSIVAAVAERAAAFEGTVVFTRDTHDACYADTQEGRCLPIAHCRRGTPGWELVDELEHVRRDRDCLVFDKPSFGSLELATWLVEQDSVEPIDSIELVGLCTDICVVSNALLIKANLPEVPLRVESSLCAGVTLAAHDAALATMRSCQIEVL